MGIWLFLGSGFLLLISVLWSRFRKRQRRFIKHMINGFAVLGIVCAIVVFIWGLYDLMLL